MLRLRRESGAVVLDRPGPRGPGRGAYICANMGCWEAAWQRRALGRALRINIAGTDQERLTSAFAGMISNSPTEADQAGNQR